MKLTTVSSIVSLANIAYAATIVLNSDAMQYFGDANAADAGVRLNLDERRLVQLHPDHQPVWMTEQEKIQAKANGINFMDITEAVQSGAHSNSNSRNEVDYPSPNSSKKVKPILKTLSIDGMRQNLEKFTSFRTRYYRSETGRQSQLWLLQKINEITSNSASKSIRDLISINEFPHSWGQNSIIVRINGSSSADDSIVVIGAHQDSTHSWPFLPAPGADDDGSGTMSILEAYRGLITAGFQPQRAVEFHWYSAEEGGLLGSQAVANDYARRGINVYAMSQFDMTAWVKRGTVEAVGIIMDYTNAKLTELNKKLVKEYLDIPYVETKCGYACSDHASWSKQGYPSIFTIESKFEDHNPYIHSGDDRIDISSEFSFTHMLEFAKLAAAFAVELGQWKD